MASFIRSLLQIILGFALGFAAATYYLPDARKAAGNTGTGKGPTLLNPNPRSAPNMTHAVSDKTDDTLFGRHSGGQAPAGAFAQPKVDTPRPEPAPNAVTESRPEPVKEAPVPVAVIDEPVDFRELCIKPAAWPPTITLNKEINAQVMQGEEVIAEIPLNPGEKLQVSKVFGDATVEVRAKGAKFIVKAADTDLAAQARLRLAEISGRVRAPAPIAPTPESAPAKPVAKPSEPAPSQPKGDDLDAKMRSLFGNSQKK